MRTGSRRLERMRIDPLTAAEIGWPTGELMWVPLRFGRCEVDVTDARNFAAEIRHAAGRSNWAHG